MEQQSAPAPKRGRPKKDLQSAPALKQSAPAKRGRPKKDLQSAPAFKQLLKPKIKSISSEQKQSLMGTLSYYVINVMQSLERLKDLEEKSENSAMAKIASDGITRLLDGFVYPVITLYNNLNKFNTVEDDYPIIEKDEKYYLDNTTLAEFREIINKLSNPQYQIDDLIHDLKIDGIKISFE
jgi:hypothetical protein